MVRDHALLVGRDDINPDPACPGRNQAPPLGVGRLVQFDAEPAGFLADPRADRGGVLADAGREDDSVEAFQGCCQRTEGDASPVDEVIQGELGARVVAGVRGLSVNLKSG